MERILILGAAGRDFHVFNVLFRDNPNYKVVGFTAAQIPFIENRKYPKELAGRFYKNGINIYPERKLEEIIKKLEVDICILAYSDLSYRDVFEKARIANKAGAHFMLLAPQATMLKSKRKVIAVCASRTGAGKSEVTRYIARILREHGKKFVVVRHPMPYGDLRAQRVQRFEKIEDLDKYNCTIEEREEYAPHIREGNVVYAGVDYKEILKAAEREAEIILWDGGNNDLPFFKPDLLITVVDPLRADCVGEAYPGALAVSMADAIVINKVNVASKSEIKKALSAVRTLNSRANIFYTSSIVIPDKPELIPGKRVLVVEDGPSVTHGGLKFGAASVCAKQLHAKEIVDPHKYATGSIAEAYKKYNIGKLLPALGYSRSQISELSKTLNRAECDVIVSSTIKLEDLMKLNKPVVNVTFEIARESKLSALIKNFAR